MTTKKETLLDVILEASDGAAKAEKIGQELVQSARFSLDIAACMRQTLEALPNDESLRSEQWNQCIGSWQTLKDAVVSIQGSKTEVQSFSANATATGLTVSTIVSDLNSYVFPAPVKNILVQTTSRLSNIVDRDATSSNILTEMKRLHLDIRGGDRQTAVELFEQAKAAIDRPTLGEGSPIAILIALRESIDAIIDELIKRRLFQEPAKKVRDKISSIGRQSGRLGLTEDHFARLGDDASRLRDDLSGGKQDSVSRAELTSLFQRTTLFLKALLQSIDETKLKK